MASDVKLGLDADTSSYNAKMKSANEEVKKIGKSNKKQKSEWQKQIPILGKLNTLMSEGALKAGAIALAVGLIAKAWINVEKARELALSENLAASGGSKLLAQISTSPEQTIQLKALSQQLATEPIEGRTPAARSAGIREAILRHGQMDGPAPTRVTGDRSTPEAVGSCIARRFMVACVDCRAWSGGSICPAATIFATSGVIPPARGCACAGAAYFAAMPCTV